jgi:hypothetical protein
VIVVILTALSALLPVIAGTPRDRGFTVTRQPRRRNIPAYIISAVLRYWPFGGRQFSPEIERIISRRRLAAWTAVAATMTIPVAAGAGSGYFYGLVLALWAVSVAFAAAQTIRLRRGDVTTVWFLDSWFRPIRPELIADRDSRPFWPVRLILLTSYPMNWWLIRRGIKDVM